MTPLVLALALGGAPELWVATQGLDGAACDSTALAARLHAQRPGAIVHAWNPEAAGADPPAGAVRVRLAAEGGVTRLEITGAGNSITRTLPAADGCERNVEIAALIVDGALDELRAPGASPTVDSLAPPVPLRKRMQVGVGVGAGVEQGPISFVAALDAGAVVRYRWIELTLDADLALPASTPFTVQPPEQVGTGTLSVTMLDAELGLGVAPRLGPGRLSADLLAGLSFASASSSTSSNAAILPHQAPQTATEFYTGLRLGYVVELPLGLFVGARVEERLAPKNATFEVVGADLGSNPARPSNNPADVTTQTWTFQALGLVGVRFL